MALEVANIKHVAPACKLEVNQHIIADIRYADNIPYSFPTKKEQEEVAKDIIQSYNCYNLPLKYCTSTQKYQPKVVRQMKKSLE